MIAKRASSRERFVNRSRPSIAKMRAMLAFLGCLIAAPAAATTHFVIPTMPGGGFYVDMSTMLDRRFYTVVRQRYDFSCGSAALATLLRYHYGVRNADEELTFNGMWEHGDQAQIKKFGFSLLDMKRFLETIKLQTQGFRVTLDQIAQTRVPGIALTTTRGYKHFVVIKGVSKDYVLIGDPSRGLLRISRPEFEKMWDGLFFVITDARQIGQSSFNRAGQWAMVGHVPFGALSSRPVDLDTLRTAITNPVLGEQ